MSDLSLPGQDGFDRLRALRSSRDLKAVPAIAITGHDNLRLRAEQAGYQGFMMNPFDTDELCRAIGALTRRRAGTQG